MATEIGMIKTLIGTAVATAADGSQRTLQAGDRVFQDEVITTGAAGAVEIEFSDGSLMTLGRSSQTILDIDAFDPQAVAQTPTDVDSEVDALQQALLEGADPSQIGEATAAGAGAGPGGNEGTDFVQVLYEAPEVTPESGFETTGITVEFDDEREEVPFDDVPTAGITTVLLDEDDLISEQELSEDFEALRAAFEAATGFSAFAANAQGIGDEADGDDLPPGALTVLSGTLAVDFGANGAGDITFNAAATQPAGLTSGGDDIQYFVSADGHSLIAYTFSEETAEIIFTAEITDVLTGAFTVALYGPVDHGDGATEDNLTVDFGFTISDIDGDTAQGTLRFDIDDDAPVIGASKAGTVDEEGLATLATQDDGYDGDAAGSNVTFDGDLNINWGADDNNSGETNNREVVFDAQEAPEGLVSNGVAVTYEISEDGTVITATAGEATVFTVSLSDLESGSYNFALLDNLDHPATDTEDDINLTFAFTVTDSDGDSASSSFNVVIDDDAPVTGETIAQVDEDDLGYYQGGEGNDYNPQLVAEDSLDLEEFFSNIDLPGGAPWNYYQGVDDEAGGDDLPPESSTTVEGTLNVNFGADGPGGIVFNEDGQTQGLTSQGDDIQYWVSEDGQSLVAYTVREFEYQGKGPYGKGPQGEDGPSNEYVEVVFTAEILDSSTGEYRVTLYSPVDHPDTTTEDNVQIELGYTATDFDGDSAQGTLTVDVDDDSPIIVDDLYQGGEDNDYRGEGEDLTVDEDDIDGRGNDDRAPGDDYSNTYQYLALDFGADGPAETDPVALSAEGIVDQNGNALTSNGVELQYTWDGDSDTLIGYTDDVSSPVLTISVENVYQYGADIYIDLLDNLDHPINSTEDNLEFDVTYTVTDFDGDSVSSTFAVDIDDDMPTIVPQRGSVDEEGLDGGNAGDSYNTETVTGGVLLIPELEVGNLNSALSGEAKDTIRAFVENGGNLVINAASGSNDESLINSIFGFSISSGSGGSPYTKTGDAAGTDFAAGPASLSYENGTYQWSASSLPAEAKVMYGSGDGAAVVVIPVGSGQITFLAYDWFNAAPVGSQDGGWLEILDIAVTQDGSSPADVSVFDNGSFVDTNGSYSSESDNIQATLNGQGHNVTTFTGITAADFAAALQVTIGDLAGEATTAHGNLGISWGADDRDVDGTDAANPEYDRSVSFDEQSAPEGLTSNGVPVVYGVSEDGLTLTATVGETVVFTVVISDEGAGTYDFTLLDNLDHPEGATTGEDASPGTEDDITLIFDFTATDSDGDAVGSHFTITVDDDAPVIGNGEDSPAPEDSTVDEEGLATAATQDDAYAGDVAGIELKAAGDLNISWGSDDNNAGAANRSVSFDATQDALTALALESDGQVVSYNVSVDGTVLEATIDGGQTPVFTVSLSDLESGSYDFELFNNLDHPTADTEDDINLTFAFTATDSDGDTANSSFTVTVDDDAPVIGEALSENDGNSILLGARDGSAGLDDWGVTPGALTGSVTMNGVTANIAFQDNDSNANSKLRIYNNNANHIGGGSLADNDGQGINAGETLTISFDKLMQQAEIGVDGLGNHFLPNAPQQAHATWVAYKNGVEVGSGEIDNPEGQNEGPAGLLEVFTVSIPGGFDTIVLGNNSNNDGSNYEVRYLQAQTLNIIDEEGLQPEGNLGDSYSDNGDVAGATLTTSADLNIIWGADDNNDDGGQADRSVTFDDVQSGLAGLTSNDVPVTIVLSEGDTVLTAKAGDATVFTVTLSDLESGKFDFSLLDNLDHPTANTEDDINLTFAFTATDSDGDTVNGSFGVTVDDDGPTVGKNARVVADEDNLSDGNHDKQPGDDKQKNLEGTLKHNYGADNEGSIDFAAMHGVNANFTSNGNDVSYVWNEGTSTLTAVADGGAEVFTVVINPTTGAYTFELLDNVDHPEGGRRNDDTENPNINLVLTYTVTDGDGDTADGTLRVRIDDDVPVNLDQEGSIKVGGVEEDALTPEGNREDPGQHYATTITAAEIAQLVSAGADEPVAISLNFAETGEGAVIGTATGLTQNGVSIVWQQNGESLEGVVLGTDTVVFTITPGDGNPDFRFTLLDNIDHDDDSDLTTGTNDAFVEQLALTNVFVATDYDGDAIIVDAGAHITIENDVPTVSSNETIKVDDDALPGGNPGGVNDNDDAVNLTGTLSHSYGADGEGTVLLQGTTSTIYTYTVSDGGKLLTVTQDQDGVDVTVVTVTLDDATSGAYTVVQHNPVIHSPASDENNSFIRVNYQVTDGDGDTVDGLVTISVDDDTPVIRDIDDHIYFNEDDLLASRGEGESQGNDESAPREPLSVSRDIRGDVNWGADGFGRVTSIDLDGEDLIVMPETAGDDSVTVYFDETGAVTTVAADASVTLLVNENGDYTVTLNDNLLIEGAGQNLFRLLDGGIQINAADSDGDEVAGGVLLKIDVRDDVPTASHDHAEHVRLDDDAQSGGNPGGVGDHDPDSEYATGTLIHSYGADGAGSTLLLDSHQEDGFVYTLNGDSTILTISQDGADVLRVTLDGTTSGDYTVEQLAAISHDAGGDENNQRFQIDFQVTDGDGDTANSYISIYVDDDTPVVTSESDTLFVEEDDLDNANAVGNNEDGSVDAHIATGNLADNFSFGADGAAAAAIFSVNGIEAVADEITVTTATYSLVVTASTGDYTFTLLDNVLTDPAIDNGENNQSLPPIDLTVVAEDGDGDQVTGEITLDVTVQDDIPVISTISAPIVQESFENLRTTNGWHVEDEGVTGNAVEFIGDHGVVWTTNVAGIELQRGNVGGSTASDGQTHAELDSHNFQDNGPGDTTLTVLSTTVTLPGTEATLSFDYKPRPADQAGSDMKVTVGGVEVIIDGQAGGGAIIDPVAGVTITQTTSASGWITVTLSYEGLAPGETELSIAGLPDASGGSNTLGAYLDNISFDGNLSLQVDETTLSTDDSVDFSAYFSSSYGADGAGSLDYALTLETTDSGLVDTATDNSVFLFVESGVVVGREGTDATEAETGEVVFTVGVDGNGVVTLDQIRAVHHGEDGNDHDSVVGLATEILNLEATITDADGDTATSSLDLGARLSFRDDGPSITATTPSEISYELTVTNHDDVSSAGYNNSYGYYIKDADGNPTTGLIIWSDVHADKDAEVTLTMNGVTPDQVGFFILPNAGRGSTPENDDMTEVRFEEGASYWKVIRESDGEHLFGASSALFDVADLNQDDTHHVENNALIGNQNWEDLPNPGGDADYNDVNVNAQWKALTHLIVDETELNESVSTSASVDLSGQFVIDAGADGLESILYALTAVAGPSGLVDTATGENVVLSESFYGVVEGRTELGGDLVFTLSVDSNGVAELTQFRAVVHGNPLDHDETLTPATLNVGSVTLSAIVTDGDGDTATAGIDIASLIAFEDDGPTANADEVNTNEDTTFTFGVLGNDVLSADGTEISSFTQPQNGDLILNEDNTFTYTPADNLHGQQTFTYTLTDGDGDFSTATVTINVAAVADAPNLIMSVGEPTITTVSAPGYEAIDYKGDSYFVAGGGTLKDSTVSTHLTFDDVKGYGIGGGSGVDAIDKNESLMFDMKGNVSSATFDVTVDSGSLNAQWLAYDVNGNEIETGGISSTGTITVSGIGDFAYIAFDAADGGSENDGGFYVLPVSSLGATDFIVNGSFEDLGNVDGGGAPILGELTGTSLTSQVSIPGWETIAGAPMEPHAKGHADVGATDGNHYMDMGATPGNSSIEQIFTTLSAGQDYQLSFDYRDKAAMQEGGPDGLASGVMNVKWNGVVIATIDGDNVDAYESFSINVTATGNDSLVFEEIGESDDNWGIAIDNVQLFGVTDYDDAPETTYSYDLSIAAALTDVDGSETLSGVSITGLPTGVTIAETSNGDGTYNPGTLTLVSDHELSGDEINDILGSVTSTDNDGAPATTDSNAKVETDAIDFSGLSLVSWGSDQNQDKAPATTVNANLLALAGNSWKGVELSELGVDSNFDWSKGTLTFDVKVDVVGEIQGILFDNNLQNNEGVDKPNLIQVDGTQAWGTAAFDSEDIGDGWMRVEVDLSTLDQSSGQFNNLVFVNDDDSSAGGTGSVSFRNLSISDDTDTLLEGTSGDDTLYAGAGNDILIGGKGDDILFGGEGNDEFVWNADDVSTTLTPAHDVVEDFNAAEDVINLSDLLSDGTRSIEGIDNGSGDLQLNIKDENDVTVQEIELSGVAAGTDANATLQSLLDTNVINDGI